MATLLQEFLQNESWHNASLARGPHTFSKKRMQQQSTVDDGSHSSNSNSVTLHSSSNSTAPQNTSDSSNACFTGKEISANKTFARQGYIYAAEENHLDGQEEEELGVAVASHEVEANLKSVPQHCKHDLRQKPLSLSSSSLLPVASCASNPSSASLCLSPSRSSFSSVSSPSPLHISSSAVQGHGAGSNSNSGKAGNTENSIHNSSSSTCGNNSVIKAEENSATVVSINSTACSEKHNGNLSKKKTIQNSLLSMKSSPSPSASSIPPSSPRASSFPTPFPFSFVPCSAAASLPVLQCASAIVKAVQQHQVTFIVGETGSGKTTQIPQLMHAAGFTANGMIGITQPRRVAAVSLAVRVADEILTRRKEQHHRQQHHREQQNQQQQMPPKEQHQQREQQPRGGEMQHREHQHSKQLPLREYDVASQGQREEVTAEAEEKKYDAEKKEEEEEKMKKKKKQKKKRERSHFSVDVDRSDSGQRRSLAACIERGEKNKKRILLPTGGCDDAGRRRKEDNVSDTNTNTATPRSEDAHTGGEERNIKDYSRSLLSDGVSAAVSPWNAKKIKYVRYSDGASLTSASCDITATSCCVRQGEKAAVGAVRGAGKGETGLGGLVGYAVRFEDVTSSETRIKFMTDGLLLREAIRDPLLLQYSLLIIDEAHERSVSSDVLLGYIKLLLQKNQERNKKLRLIVMSATLETKKFLNFFPQAKLLVVPGRSFPIHILHAAEPQKDYVEAALVAAMQIHLSTGPGDILIFLPGQEDIEALSELLAEKRRLLRSAAAAAMSRTAILIQQKGEPGGSSSIDIKASLSSASGMPYDTVEGPSRRALLGGGGDASACFSSVTVSPLTSAAVKDASPLSASPKINGVGAMRTHSQQPVRICVSIGEQEYTQLLPFRDIVVCPLYAALPFDQQKAIFDPVPACSRKIILATNIAETSITVKGIRYVIDSGLMKAKVVNHRSGIEALVVREISKESAAQRAGRAAREATGVVYRLYTEETFQQFKTHRQPEIVSSDLGQIFLELKALRIPNPLEFPFLDPPSAEAFFNAGRMLHRIGALDARGDLTSIGRQLSALPLSPLLGKLLLESVRLGCSAEILSIVAMLSTDSPWNNSRGNSASRTPPRDSETRRRIIIEQSDHLTLLNAYKKWDEASDKHTFCREYGLHPITMRRAAQIRQQLEELLKSPHVGAKEIKESGSNDNWAVVRQCLAAGCWLNTARLQGDGSSYVTTVQRLVAKLHPSSVLFGKAPLPGYIVYSEYVQTTKPYLRCVTAIEGSWLQQLVPRWFSAVENVI